MAVIDPNAILQGRSPGRPPVGVIVGIAVSSLCLLVSLGYAAVTGGAPFVAGLILALLPLGLWLPLVLALDRLEPEPPNALVLAFLWGAGVATLVAAVLNTLGLMLVTTSLSPEEGWYVTATFEAPFVEEILKGLVLFGMLWFRRHELNGPTDGVIYAAMVGLGFAAVENVTYFISAVEADLLGYTFLMRGVLSPLLHPLCTAMTGLGVTAAALAPRGSVKRWAAPLGGLAGAIALHMLWNGSTRWGYAGLSFAYLVGLCVLIGVSVALVRDRRRTVGLVTHHLTAYLPSGLVTPADLTMLSTLRSRRLARTWAQSVGGTGAARAMRDYQHGATELAMLHERVARGAEDPVVGEPQRQALLMLMQVARQAFLIRQPHPPAAPWSAGGATGFSPAG
ncbi:PrsW family intramembrane metalloprotease [Antribacter gilvus]|uniref:PrsW family intramembrane metalloprotease n=1 Tax=Antribacter gilvus TaxID=2304675 RepID=UPI000F76BE44|nr:PrsW family intramembrane metalloprotease [Antribacter gilvus]